MSRFSPRFAAGAATLARLSGAALILAAGLGVGGAFAQGGPPRGAAGPPPGFTPPAAPQEAPRPGGLRIGPQGYTVGDSGGLDKELSRNGNVPPGPALLPGSPAASADPRDFQGAWYGDQYIEAFEHTGDMYGAKLPFTERGRKVMDQRLLAQDRQEPYITPTLVCRPSGHPWAMIRIPFQIFQSKDRIDVFTNADRARWQIPLDPALAFPEGTKGYMGRSVGHWEGDALVVETTGFRNRIWLSFRGTPVSPGGKLTDRIRKVTEDGRTYLDIITTVDDPAYYTRPWKYARSYSWRPDFATLEEYNCEQQSDDPNGTAGFAPEPAN